MRRAHKLKANAKCERPDRIIYFDSESRVQMTVTDDDVSRLLSGDMVEKPHDPYLICATFKRRTKNGTMKKEKRDYYYDNFLERFWSDVDSFCPWRKRIYVVSHNAKYDVLVTKCIPLLIEHGYKVESFSDANPFILRMRKARERVNKDGETVRDYKTIVIFSSTNYYQTSLAALGKTFGIEKGQHDHEAGGENLEQAIQYCRTDVDILEVAVDGFIDFVQKENLGNFSMTVAGQAFNAYRHRFMNADIFIHDNLAACRMERDAYAGGRNECFWIGRVPEDEVYGCDVNSMYPSVMLDFQYPTRIVSVRALPSLSDVRKWLESGYMIVAECYVETDVPIFHRKGGKLVFPIGRFWTTLSTPEIVEGLKRDIIKKVRKVAIYKGSHIFREYVEYFYTQRLKAKTEGDKVHDMLYKLFLNSLYGKFGQKNEHWERIGDADPEEIRTEWVIDTRTGERYLERVVGGGIFRRHNDPDDVEAVNSFPAIAAHVTAYARMRLWQYIETAGLGNVYYCDTDSVYVNREGYERLEQAGLIDDKKLGLLKLERVCTDFTLYGCKDYEFIEVDSGVKKVKMKGVSKSAVQIEDDKEGKKRFVITQWSGVSDGLRKGSLQSYSNRLIIKTLRREYDKGIVTETGKVEPFRLDEAVRSEKVEKILQQYLKKY